MTESLRRQRPHGLNDLFDEQAGIKALLEQRLHSTFAQWGYDRISLPTFGYYESLSQGAGPQLQRQMVRFFDREGNILALRTDMTVPTARLVGTRLYDQPMPLRFYYSGSVFRHEKPQAGQRHEFTQSGIELIGAATPEADAEVVSLAVSALQALGISDFQINLGHVAYLRAAMANIGLSDDDQYLLEQVIARKNDLELARTLDRLQIEDEAADLIRAVPHLYGRAEVLSRARQLATSDTAQEACSSLARVYELLIANGVSDHIILDLGEVRSMAYYTGIAFRGYVRGLGFHVCSGGRYDDLIARFGPPLPAVGFALGIERAMLVTDTYVDLGPDVLISASGTSDGHRLVARLRELGLRVEADVLSRHGAALTGYGRSRKARWIIDLEGEERGTVIDQGERRSMTLSELREEIEQWSR